MDSCFQDGACSVCFLLHCNLCLLGTLYPPQCLFWKLCTFLLRNKPMSMCVSWISFLSSTNKNSDSHFISNMDKTQTIILSEKSQTQHAALWIISFMRFKGGLEQDIRDLFRVAEMFYWGDNCKNVLICLNTSNIVLKIWTDLLYLNYISIKLSLRKRTHEKKRSKIRR